MAYSNLVKTRKAVASLAILSGAVALAYFGAVAGVESAMSAFTFWSIIILVIALITFLVFGFVDFEKIKDPDVDAIHFAVSKSGVALSLISVMVRIGLVIALAVTNHLWLSSMWALSVVSSLMSIEWSYRFKKYLDQLVFDTLRNSHN